MFDYMILTLHILKTANDWKIVEVKCVLYSFFLLDLSHILFTVSLQY